ncbi:MAG: YbhB/YbcL family Raf kinase inhibitor-like protein [Bryobacteraceae bacterium]
MPFTITVDGFREGETIPRIHTCEGADVSPSITWTGEPSGTRSFALIVDDPDAPAGTWNHWLLWDIPAAVHTLASNFRPGTAGVSGANDFGRPGYGGPCPPRRHGPHRYYFRLYAIDVESIGLDAGAKRAQLDRAIEGHILSESAYMGRYERL